jgi:LytS/YehU family sensor histidine kinase
MGLQPVFPNFIAMKHRLWLHILFWTVYVLFQANIEFAWMSTPGATTPAMQRWWMSLTGEIFQLPIKIPVSYYIVYLINNGSAKFKRPAAILFAAIAALIVAVVLDRVVIIKFILPYIYHEKVTDDLMFKIPRIISSLLDLLFVVGLVVAIKQYRIAQQSREKEKQLIKEKLEAELKFLRTQTNPHFLFNTLNNIYALARKKSDDTADVVMKLSKLLRFMLYESKNRSITLVEELRVLKDYIELERIRYNERLTISFTEAVDDEAQPIAPLILLPFVENAFKHGASETRFTSFIYIHILLKEAQLIFTIENSKEEESGDRITENIGLSNVRRQLELMYPEHRLEMEVGKTIFKVTLTINLANYAAI